MHTSRLLLIVLISLKPPSKQIFRRSPPERPIVAVLLYSAQSQTLARVLLDCREWAFMHGHFYVGSSRVFTVDNIRLYVRREHVYFSGEQDCALIKNVVYKDILLINT